MSTFQFISGRKVYVAGKDIPYVKLPEGQFQANIVDVVSPIDMHITPADKEGSLHLNKLFSFVMYINAYISQCCIEVLATCVQLFIILYTIHFIYYWEGLHIVKSYLTQGAICMIAFL